MLTYSLTLPEASRIIREAERALVRSKVYLQTPVGPHVAHFLRWFTLEEDAQATTLRDYESILAKMCLYFSDLELADLEPPVGTERLREFIAARWGERREDGSIPAARTRKKVRSVLVTFFEYCVDERLLHANPARPIRAPKTRRGVERAIFSPDEVGAIVGAQETTRDRLAVLLLVRLALRKSELAAIQFRHFDRARGALTVFGKGRTTLVMPLSPFPDLLAALDAHLEERDPRPSEFLLYPQKLGPAHGRYSDVAVIWEDRYKPKAPTTMHRWWYGCLERAGVTEKGVTSGAGLHTARHTALTDFHREFGDTFLTQALARHADSSTTERYVHETGAALEAALNRRRQVQEGPSREELVARVAELEAELRGRKP